MFESALILEFHTWARCLTQIAEELNLLLDTAHAVTGSESPLKGFPQTEKREDEMNLQVPNWSFAIAGRLYRRTYRMYAYGGCSFVLSLPFVQVQRRVVKNLPDILALNCQMEQERDFSFWTTQLQVSAHCSDFVCND